MPFELLMEKLRELEEWRKKAKLQDCELEVLRVTVETKQKAVRQVQRQVTEMRDQNRSLAECVETIKTHQTNGPASSVLFDILDQQLEASQSKMGAKWEAAVGEATKTDRLFDEFNAERDNCKWLRALEEAKSEHKAAVEQLAQSKRELKEMTVECEEAEKILKEREEFDLTTWVTKMSREAMEAKRLRQRYAQLLVINAELSAKKKDDSIDVEMGLLTREQAAHPPAAQTEQLQAETPIEQAGEQEAAEEPFFAKPHLPATPKPAEKAAKKRVEGQSKHFEEPPKKARAETRCVRQPSLFESATQRVDEQDGPETAEDTPLTEEQAPETESNIIQVVIDGDEEEKVTPQNSPFFGDNSIHDNDNSPTSSGLFDLFGEKHTPKDARPPPNGTPKAPPRSPRAIASDDENPLGSLDLNASNNENSFNFDMDGGDMGEIDFNMDFGEIGPGGDSSVNFDLGGTGSPRDNTTEPFNFDHSHEGNGGGNGGYFF